MPIPPGNSLYLIQDLDFFDLLSEHSTNIETIKRGDGRTLNLVGPSIYVQLYFSLLRVFATMVDY